MEEKTPQKMGVWNSMCYTVRTIWRADKDCILLSFIQCPGSFGGVQIKYQYDEKCRGCHGDLHISSIIYYKRC